MNINAFGEIIDISMKWPLGRLPQTAKLDARDALGWGTMISPFGPILSLQIVPITFISSEEMIQDEGKGEAAL